MVIIGGVNSEAHFLVLYPFWINDVLSTINIHHCLSLFTIGCPLQQFILWVILGKVKFQAYFGVLFYLFLINYVLVEGLTCRLN